MQIMDLINELHNNNLTYIGRKKIMQKIKKIEEERDIYLTRCRKAIDFLNNDSKYTDDDFEGRKFQNDLLAILYGKDD